MPAYMKMRNIGGPVEINLSVIVPAADSQLVVDALKAVLELALAKEKVLSFELKTPNALTAETLEKADCSEDLHEATDAADLFRKLGV